METTQRYNDNLFQFAKNIDIRRMTNEQQMAFYKLGQKHEEAIKILIKRKNDIAEELAKFKKGRGLKTTYAKTD